MSEPLHSNEMRQSLVEELVAEYRRRRTTGEKVERKAFLLRYPYVAEALQAEFDNVDRDLQTSTPAVEKTLESGSRPGLAGQSLRSSETVAPRGIGDSVAALSGPFPNLPAAFGRYRVEKLLGSGMMGAVYLARDTQLDRPVALKVPRLTGHEESDVIARLQREARAAANLHHPNICGVYDVGVEAGTCFIAMEFIEGRPLSDFVAPGQLQEPRKSVDVVRKLASALAEAHSKGIIHRDLKPANILINPRGEPIVTDFGLARLTNSPKDGRATQAGTLIGSPAYMSPEQANGETDKIGPHSDIYSLGVLLFELLTSQLPFQGSVLTILSQIATKEAPLPSSMRPGLDQGLDQICRRMMAKHSQDRFSSMAAVEDALMDWLKSSASEKPAIKTSDSASKMDVVVGLAPVTGKTATTTIVSKSGGATIAEDFSRQEQRAKKLLSEHNYEAAIPLLKKLSELKDPLARQTTAWAKQILPSIKEKQQKLSEQTAQAMEKARGALKKHDYAGAIQVLQLIPASARSDELQKLLSEATDLADECATLRQDIDDAVKRKKYDRLDSLVRRYLKLKPDSPKMERLLRDLLKNRAARAVAQFKGTRRYIDVGGRLIAPTEMAVGLLAVIAIFFATSASVRWYLDSESDSSGVAQIGSEGPKPSVAPPTAAGFPPSAPTASDNANKPTELSGLPGIGSPASLSFESNEGSVHEAANKARSGDVDGAISLLMQHLAKSPDDRGALQLIIQLLQYRSMARLQRNDRGSALTEFIETANYARRLQKAYKDLSQSEYTMIANALYNGACGQALSSQYNEALATLKDAQTAGYSNWKWAAEDGDLQALRGLPEFRSLLYSTTSAGGSLQRLLDLDFAKSTGGFVVNEADYLKVTHTNGEWQYMAKKPGDWFWIPQPGLHDTRLSEFVFEADFRLVDLQHPGGWFLRFSDVRGKSSMDFHVKHDGQVGVFESFAPGRVTLPVDDARRRVGVTEVIEPGTEKWLIPLTRAAAMLAATEQNTVRLEVLNGVVSISVNGQPVATASESRVAESGLMIFAHADQPPVDVRFRRIRLWRPEQKSSGDKASPGVSNGGDVNRDASLAAAHRRFAEWVIAGGGYVQTTIGRFSQTSTLPKNAFAVVHADLVNRSEIAAEILDTAERLMLRSLHSDKSHDVAVRLANKSTSTLTRLQFRGAVTNAQISQLKDSDVLRAIVFLESFGFTEEGMKNLKRFPNLTHVAFNPGPLTDAGLAHLAGLKQIDDLMLWGTGITDAGLVHLKEMSGLRSLQLGTSRGITGPGLQHLVGLSNLKTLSVHDTSFGDSGMAYLGDLAAIEELHMAFTKITDDSLQKLSRARTLRLLSVSGTKVTDAGLRKLAQHESLAELYVSETEITNAGLEAIRGLKNLKRIDIRKTKVTGKGVRDLKKAAPFCEIVYDLGSSLFDPDPGAKGPRVLVLGGGNTLWDETVMIACLDRGHRPKLVASSVKFDGSQADLEKFDAVVLLNNANWSPENMPSAGQRALRKFVSDGGGLVTGEWLLYNAFTQNRHTELQTLLPATVKGWNSNVRSTAYSQLNTDPTLNAGVDKNFQFDLANIGGSETFLIPKTRAKAYYNSSNSKVAGLVGWDFLKGRVASFSTFITSVELANPNYRRLFTNTIEWSAKKTATK